MKNKAMKKQLLISAIADLKKAFEYNLLAHKLRDYINDNYDTEDVSYEVNERNKNYYLKVKYIKKCIGKIKQYKLPIKYGTNKGITYFEYNGQQVSFHTFSSIDDCGGKKFKGERNEKINASFPIINY